MFTDFSFPDPTAVKPQVDLDKFLGIDEDKTPTVFTPDQSLEDLLFNLVTVLGISIAVKEYHFVKQLSPIYLSPLVNCTFERLVQF